MDIKALLDIGMGALALGLFAQQSQILKQLRIIVGDHATRITSLERGHRALKAARKKK